MTRAGRTQTCGTAESRTRLAHAKKFLEVAELTAGEDMEASQGSALRLPWTARSGLRWLTVARKRQPTPEEAVRAVGLLLDAVEAGSDIFDTLDEMRPLHPKNNTFPGEVFMRLAARALAEGGVSPATPIPQEGLIDTYLPEARFRGRQHQKIRYAVLVATATHAGVEVDLLEEVAYWGSDDFWSYAGLAAAAWIRAVADNRQLPLPDLVGRLREVAATLA